MKNERATLAIKTERCEEALQGYKEDMRGALIDICGVEAPNDSMTEDIFRMKLEVQISEMKEQIQTLDAEMSRKSKNISKESEEELEQRVQELEQKVNRLDNSIELAKVNSVNAGSMVDTTPAHYQDLVAQVVSHLKRLRVVLRRILNAVTTEEREKGKKLCRCESTLFQDTIKRRANKLEEIQVDATEICSRSQALCNYIVHVKIE
jgi:DNA polymerase II small subunit/DNA polymerase delta subunit B